MLAPRGVGIGLRQEHHDAWAQGGHHADWLEIVPENYLRSPRHRGLLDRLCTRMAVGVHGVSMDVGGYQPLNVDLLRRMKALMDDLGVPLFTEHLCFSVAGARHFHNLLPLPMTEEAVVHVADRVSRIQDALQRPVALENISTYAIMPGSVMTEGEFITRVLERSSAGLLLDVNNVYVNARNHGLDAHALLMSLPLQRTQRIHVAGHRDDGHMVVDDHGSPVAEPVMELLHQALQHTGEVPVLLEWDTRIPSLGRVLEEADRVRAVVDHALMDRAAA